jgi:hypothetical protein
MKQTKVQQVAEVLRNNPDITIKALAKKFNTTITYAYVLRSQARSSNLSDRVREVSNGKAKLRMSDNPAVIQGFTGKQYELMDFTPTPFTVEEVLQKAEEDAVNHPPHYKTGGIEVIDFIEAKGFNYRLGNVIKYVSRASHKGNYIQDLEKAKWYLEREINKAKDES